MRIVVLDGYTLNPGDLSWSELEALGDCTVHDRTPAGDTVARAEGAEIVLTNKTILARETLDALPALRYIGVLATGYNVVDADAARERHIPVTNVPTYGTRSVAQMVFAHVLNLTQQVAHHAHTVRDGKWSRSDDFCYWDVPLEELEGKAMGIVGYGRIGKSTAQLALAFGMHVFVHDPVTPWNLPVGITAMDLDTLFRESDIVTLHCPLTDDNAGFVNARMLEAMKPTAFLVNTSRGPLIDEAALAEALNTGCIAGAGLDVLSVEPPSEDNPLLQATNCFITPHIAWATKSARGRLLDTAVDNVRAFLEGTPKNVVNPW
ncbi:MAG: D-2-hydroxyacid dehydrogenase [Lentisphaerae bacterium]|nr:D-2-hydroxyacid dehydrogenase [Lentisphaerota bacterium]